MLRIISKNDKWRLIGLLFILIGSVQTDFMPFREFEFPIIGKIESNGIDLIGWVLVLYPFIRKYIELKKNDKNNI